MRVGKMLRREAKRDGGDKPVEANMQSNIAGIAAGGTFPKPVDSEAMRESMDSLFIADISKSTLFLSLGVSGGCRGAVRSSIQTQRSEKPYARVFLFRWVLCLLLLGSITLLLSCSPSPVLGRFQICLLFFKL
jgi:hypothetical protein